MPTTIAPAIGHAPLFTQAGTGAAPGYDFIDFRRALSAGKQEGVMAAGSFEVTQRATSANMSVDIAANVADASGSGVAALVQGRGIVNQGLYPIPPHSAVINEAVTNNASGNPRIDQVVLELRDTTHDGSLANDARVRVIAGTPTVGATLDNRTGAANLATACPGGYLLLADILVANGAATITNSVIRDRRRWARGAYCRVIRTTNAGGSVDYTTSSTNIVLIDATNLAPRIECSGVPLRVRLRCPVSTGGATAYFSPQVDGAGADGMTSVGANPTGQSQSFNSLTSVMMALEWVTVPSAGSHIIAPGWAVQSGTVSAFVSSSRPLIWEIEEIVRQNSRNNATTTG